MPLDNEQSGMLGEGNSAPLTPTGPLTTTAPLTPTEPISIGTDPLASSRLPIEPVANPVAKPFDGPTIENARRLEKEEEAKRVAFTLSQDVDTDKKSRAMKIAKTKNLPVRFVEDNLESFDEFEKTQSAMDISKKAPALSKWLQNPDNAGLVKNDASFLTSAELAFNDRSYFTDLKDSTSLGMDQLMQGGLFFGLTSGTLTPDEFADQLVGVQTRMSDYQANKPDFLKKADEMIQKEGGDIQAAFNDTIAGFKEARDGDILKGLQQFGSGGFRTIGQTLDFLGELAKEPRATSLLTVQSLTSSSPSIGLAAVVGGAGTAAGSPVAGLVGAGASYFAGTAAISMGVFAIGELEKRGVDLTDRDAVLAAVSDKKFLDAIKTKARRYGLTMGAVEALSLGVAGKFLKTAGAGVKSKVAAGSKELLAQSGMEGAGEFSAQLAAEGDITKVDIADVALESILSMPHSAIEVTMSAEMRSRYSEDTATAATEVAKDTKQAIAAKENVRRIEAVAEQIKQTTDIKKVPGAIKDLVDLMGQQNNQPEKLYFQKEEFDGFWASRPMSDEQQSIVADSRGEPYIELSFGDYIEHFATKDDLADLHNIARLEPSQMSLKEANEMLGNLPSVMQGLALEARDVDIKKQKEKTDKQIRDVQVKDIRNNIKKQLKDVGYTDKDASSQALLLSERFRVRSEAYGVSPKELFDQRPLTVRAVDAIKDLGAKVFGQDKKNTPTFYSKLDRMVEAKVPNSATPEQIRATLKDVKAEELEWSGLDKFLEGKEKVSKAELLEHLRANQLEVVDVTLGSEASLKAGDTVYRFFSKDGEWLATIANEDNVDQKHKELADELDVSLDDIDVSTAEYDGDETIEDDDTLPQAERPTKFESYTLPGGENYREVLFTLPEAEGDQYKSSHFDEANILAHVRLNDRVDSEGNKVLFVEEIQSDWHQAGRKRGYKEAEPTVDEKKLAELRARLKELAAKEKALREKRSGLSKEIAAKYGLKSVDLISFEGWKDTLSKDDYNALKVNWDAQLEAGRATRELLKEFPKEPENQDNKVPNAPFKKTWHEFAFKNILRMAAEGGYDKVAWTTGEQQNERYDLAKQLNSVDYIKQKNGKYWLIAFDKNNKSVFNSRDIPESEIEDYVGKDLAKKIVAGEGEDDKGFNKLSGLDLAIGGEGMKGFYDKIIPAYANKLGKKFGAKVEDIKIASQTKVAGTNDDRFRVHENDDGLFEIIDDEQGALLSDAPFDSREEADAELDEIISKQGANVKVHALPITKELKDVALNQGFELFQSKEGQARGSIDFSSDSEIIIRIARSKDPSTFLHETGHLFLEDMRKDFAFFSKKKTKTAQQQKYLDNMQGLLEFLEVKSFDEITREHHEKFARGFEQFLREGKTKNPRLKKAFALFRSWLLVVYRSSAELRVNLTPEVRSLYDSLFDSMQAVEEKSPEIDSPLYEGVRLQGLNPKDAEAYLNARAEAKDEAFHQMSVEVFNSELRKRQKIFKDKEKSLKKEAREYVESLPAFKIQTDMKDAGAKFDAGLIKSRADVGFLFNKLPKSIVTRTGGMAPDILVDFYGYNSVAEMLTDIADNSDKKQEKIDAIVKEGMNRFYKENGSVLTDDQIDAEVLRKLNNDKRMDLVRLEAQLVAKNAPAVQKKILEKAVASMPSNKLVNYQARKTIASLQISNIRPHLFMNLAKKSSQMAGQALANGDLNLVIEHKKRQQLNMALHSAALKAKEELKKINSLKKKLFRPDEKMAKTRDMDLVQTARALLAKFDLAPGDKNLDTYLEKIKKYEPDTYEYIKGIIDSVAAGSSADSMTYDDYSEILTTAQSLYDLAKQRKQMVVEGEAISLDAARQKLIDQIRFLKGDKDSKKKFDEAAEEARGIKYNLLSMKAALTRMNAFVKATDSGDFLGGGFRKFIYRPITEAIDQYREARFKSILEYKALIEKYKSEVSDQAPINAPELVSDQTGRSYLFKNKQELIGFLLHIGNPSNTQKLLRGQGWGSFDEQGILDRSKLDAFLKRTIDEKIITKDTMDLVQGVWDLFEKDKHLVQKAHKKITGFFFKEIEAQPIITPFGTYRGGYAPAKIDPRKSLKGNILENIEALEDQNITTQLPTPELGSTKSRVEAFARPLLMDLSFVPMHLDWMQRLIHIQPVAKQVVSLFKDDNLNRELGELNEHALTQIILPWIDRAVKQRSSKPVVDPFWGSVNRAARVLRKRVSLGLMMFNVKNTIEQVSGFGPAAQMVGVKNLKNAYLNYYTKAEESQALLDSDLFMKNRTKQDLFQIRDELDRWMIDESGMARSEKWAEKHGFILQKTFQDHIDRIIYLAAYEKASNDPSFTKEADRKSYAASVVRDTQGGFDPEFLSSAEAGSAMSQLFTQFFGYFNNISNFNESEGKVILQEYGFKSGKGKGKLFVLYVMGMFIPYYVASLIAKLLSGKDIDEDDDGEYVDDILNGMWESQIGGLAAQFPFLGQATMSAVNRFNDKRYDDRINLSPAVSIGESALGAPFSIKKAITTDKGKKNAVKDTLSLIQILSGKPTMPLGKPVGYLIDVYEGDARPSGPIDFTRGLITGQKGDN